MTNVKLSIIVPVYNNYNKLKKCLDSIARQSFKDIEIIVIDDGSKEMKNEKLKMKNLGLSLNYYKIEHGGAPRARNFGFTKSSGEYIFFCDADVVFLKKNSLQKFVNALDNNSDIDFVYSQFKFGWKKFPCQEFNVEDLKKNNYISGNSIIRRSALEKISETKPWDESLTRFQDWDLWLSLIEQGSRGKLISEVLWQADSGGTISKWLPSFFYKLFPNTKSVREFEKAREIILKKHKINKY